MTEPSFGGALTRLWHTAPTPLLEGIIATAPAVFAKYGFMPLVIAHFMAQISHECGAGRETVENGNYSPEGIARTWPSRFHSVAEAIPFAHNARKLFNKVYNGRMGNLPGSDMGWTFRGRGATNTTGHDGYYELAKKTSLDLVNDPDLVNKPELFLECGVVDFILCGCVPFAKDDDARNVTRHLNGGLIGLAQREVCLKQWKSALLPIHGQEALFPAPAPRAEGELRFGDHGFEVKGLQAGLKAKSYACGTDDGDYLEGTRGAVAKFQLDHGLPSTGIADAVTKQALAKSPGAPIGEGRATATVQDLREAGSRTIAGADRVGFIGWVKTLLGIGGGVAVTASGPEKPAPDLDMLQTGIDKAQQAAGMFDQVRGFAGGALGFAKPLLAHPAFLPIAVTVAIAGVLLVLESRRIKRARLDDHRSATNLGR
jgi:putative chitinase